jgi:hypothetical protein
MPQKNESVTTLMQDESLRFLHRFHTKELLYIKNSYSKYELELTSALGCAMDSGMNGVVDVGQ